LFIGPVRTIEDSDYGMVLRLHHHAVRFYMDHHVADNMSMFSRRGWAAVKHMELPLDKSEKPFVVVAMRVESSQGGSITIVEGVLMRVSRRFIPVDSSYEDRLARVLVEQDRHFVRPMHYDSYTIRQQDFILKDAAPQAPGLARPPIALHVYGAAIAPPHRSRLEKADRCRAEEAGMGFWQWDAAAQAQPPPLPPGICQRSVRQ